MNARKLDANEIFAGSEPKFSGMISKIQLIQSLNWYNQNKTSKDSEKYAQTYFKKIFKKEIPNEILKDYPYTLGFVCRLIMHGAELPESNQNWLQNSLEDIQKRIAQKTSQKPQETLQEPTSNTNNVISIQDRIQEKISEILGDLEGSLDDYIVNGYKDIPAIKAILQDRCKPLHARKVIEHFQSKQKEFSELLTTTDKYLLEAYKNFNKTQIKKVLGYINQVLSECDSILATKTTTSRKPKAPKKKSAEDLVKNLKYLEKFSELGLTSIKKTDILQSQQLWVYNTKTRKLGVYFAKDSYGLRVSGTSIENFDESRSIQKTLRKPEDILPQILKAGKVSAKKVLDTVNSVEGTLSARINSDTILLRKFN